jgi:alpha-D-xyloside xylohydrolase
MPVTGVTKEPDGILVRLQPGLMKIQVCTDRIIRVVYSPTDAIPPTLQNFSVIYPWKPAPFTAAGDPVNVTVKTAKMQVQVNRATGAVSFLDANGSPVLQEAPGGKSMKPAVVNGEQSFQPEQTFTSPADEVLYGLGQGQEGIWNWRGMPRQLMQHNTDIALPVIISSKGYGVFWNNAAVTQVNPADEQVPINPATHLGSYTTKDAGDYVFFVKDGDRSGEIGVNVDGQDLIDIQNMWVPYAVTGKANLAANKECTVKLLGGGRDAKVYARPIGNSTVFRSEVGDAIDYYYFYGPEIDDVVANFRLATGGAPMYPAWAYGFLQCKERYFNQAALLSAAAEFRKRQIPIDLIVQDWQYWGHYGWGVYKFDEGLYPDPAAMIKTVHDEHIKIMITSWSNPFGDTHNKLAAIGALIGGIDPPYIDVFNPEARKIRWDAMNTGFFSIGMDAFWQDATEPSDAGRLLLGRKTFMGSGNRLSNAYPFFASMGTYENWRKTTDAKRVFVLTRSGYPGQQRFATSVWSGDINGNWITLKRQIPDGLNLSVTGMPYWCTDTAGFFHPGDQYTSPDFNDLLIRWVQFSAFSPFLRIHGWQSNTEIWNYLPKAQEVVVAYDNFRHRMLPYSYSVASRVTHEGYTIMRPLVMDFRADPKAKLVSDEFMYGPSFLVAPVTEPDPNIAAAKTVPIPSANLTDKNGASGALTGSYYVGQNFDQFAFARRDSVLDFNWTDTPPAPSIPHDHYSVRWQGSILTKDAGEYTFQLSGNDGMRLFVNNQLIIEDWNSRSTLTKSAQIKLPAHTQVPVTIEYYQDTTDAVLSLQWAPPADSSAGAATRLVYLPAGADWYDFWTGQKFSGGQTVPTAAPIEHIPLYVRAGSIVPLGPEVQYAGEKPADPIELRVYPGADGKTTLYEDEGDNYNYERGIYAEIPFTWSDSTHTLTVGARRGQFPGMLTSRNFEITYVAPGHGTGMDAPDKPDKRQTYNGASITVQPK